MRPTPHAGHKHCRISNSNRNHNRSSYNPIVFRLYPQQPQCNMATKSSNTFLMEVERVTLMGVARMRKTRGGQYLAKLHRDLAPMPSPVWYKVYRRNQGLEANEESRLKVAWDNAKCATVEEHASAWRKGGNLYLRTWENGFKTASGATWREFRGMPPLKEEKDKLPATLDEFETKLGNKVVELRERLHLKDDDIEGYKAKAKDLTQMAKDELAKGHVQQDLRQVAESRLELLKNSIVAFRESYHAGRDAEKERLENVSNIKDYISGRSEFMRGILERGHDGFVKQVEKWEKMTPDERVEHLKELGVDLKNAAIDLKGSANKWAESEEGIDELKSHVHAVENELNVIKKRMEDSYERYEQKKREAQQRAAEYDEAWWDAAEKGLPLPAKPDEQNEESLIGSHLSQLRENVSIVGNALLKNISSENQKINKPPKE